MKLKGIYILIMMTNFIYSQNDKLINLPQSATVASLESYQESSINYSSGDLKLEIPIFTIKVDDFEFPIKLYYDYKGYDPKGMPTQVGYGWNIQDTGFISVNVRGSGDFKGNGYVFGKTGQNMVKPLLNGEYANDKITTNNILACIRDFGCDGEPDKYNILLPKVNSSFYINEEGNPYTVPTDQNKISYDVNSSFPNFKVLDSDGNLYKFEEAENFINKDCTNFLNLNDVKNSYCLTQIVTNKNKLINYSYETKKIQYKPIEEDLYDYSENYQNGGCNLNAAPSPRFCYEIDTKYLKQITYSNSLVEFSYEDRDVFTSLLKEINIKNSFGTLVSKFIFYYDTNNQLVKIEKDNNKEKIILNEFAYFGSRQKVNNSSFQPEGLYNYQLNLSQLKGTNNSRANNFQGVLNGALKKIIYPTKGFSEFSYEPHMATNNIYNTSIPYWNDDSVYDTNKSCTSTENQSDSKVITIPYDQIIKVMVSSSAPGKVGMSEAYAYAGFNENGHQTKPFYSSLQLGPNFDTSIFNIVLTANSYHEGSYISSDVGGGTSLMYVAAGNYTCTTNTSWSSGTKPKANISVSYNTKQSVNFFVPGFRLSSVKKYDLTNNFEEIKYNYNDETGRSSALIKKPGINNFRFIKQCNPTIESGVTFYRENSDVYDFNFMNSKFSSPNLGLNPVLYRFITEEFFNSKQISNGKIKYRFVSKPDEFSKVYNSFVNYTIPKVNIDNLGALSEKIIYTASGDTLQSYSYKYTLSSYNIANLAYGLPVFCKESFYRKTWPSTSFELFMGVQSIIDPSLIEKTKYILKPYILNNSNYLKLNETTTNHFKNGLLVNTQKYVYDENSGQLKSKIFTNSESEILETKYSYPQDLQNEPYVNDLIRKNIIGTPLKIETFKNDIKLSEQKTEFIKTSEDLLLPKFIYDKKGEADIDKNVDKKITYDLYDDKGNILQYTPNGATSTSMIWGYNKTYPIAKVENATYDQIATYVGNLQTLSNEDNDNCMSGDCKEQILRNKLKDLRTALPQYMISTYTYNPLVGITSFTDPKGISSYYEYDSFGRLKFVKDKDLNVIQKYCYNYMGQLTDCSDNSSTSVVFYKSTAITSSFTKKNCTTGGVGSSTDYTLPEGAIISAISQADADAEAQLKLNNEGQVYANTNPSVKCTFLNTAQSRLITRNNCAAGGSPASAWYTVAAGIHSSNISQADADAQAIDQINNNGQAFANSDTNAKCTFWNTVQSRLITRNNCAAGGTPETVTYTVPAGHYFSYNSQALADSQAQAEINNNEQAYANANGKCTFWSAAKSDSITRNNCADGGFPETVTYTVPAGRFFSYDSQALADSQAQTEIDNNLQTFANNNGKCTFWSAVQSGSIARNNCAVGGAPETVTYTVPAGRFFSYYSQELADAQAQAEISNNIQSYANANGKCTFWNAAKSGSISRNNCAPGGTPETVTYTVPAGQYFSYDSQEVADAQAQTEISNNIQSYANANGKCTFWNLAKSSSTARNNCADGGTPETVTYTVPAGRYFSYDSQEVADAQAQTEINNNIQSYANANGKCIFWNFVKSSSIARNNCAEGGSPETVTYTVPAGHYFSYDSQALADSQAQTEINNNEQVYANANGKCTFWSSVKRVSFTKDNCASGGTPETVKYIVVAGKYISTISQLDADSQAQSDIDNNGQTYANTNGKCTFYSSAKNGSFTKNDCTSGTTGSNVSYSQATGVVTSTISQADANAKGSTKFYADGQVYANANGICNSLIITNSCTLKFNRVSGSCSLYKNGSKYLTANSSGSYDGTLATGDTFYVVVNASTAYYKSITITSSVRGVLYDYGPNKGVSSATSTAFTKVGSEVITIDCVSTDML